MKTRGLLLALSIAALSACRQDMHDQPRYDPYAASDFFPDGLSARPLVENTIARGWLREDTAFYFGRTGREKGAPYVTTLPIPLTKETLERGQQRFNIYCSPCHSRLGDGEGMIVQRGFKHPPSYHTDKLRQQPVGYFFDVITNGFGVMPSYRSRVPIADRWAIIAYVRTLQYSQDADVEDVPITQRNSLDEPPVETAQAENSAEEER